MQQNIGTVRPGQVLILKRPVFNTGPAMTAPTGATLSVTIIDEHGDIVNMAPALVVSISTMNLPVVNGMSGYNIEFQVTIPDGLDGVPEGVPYTALMQFAVTDSNGSINLPPVQESFSVVGDVEGMLGPQPAVVIPPLSASLQYAFGSKPAEQSIDVSLFYGNHPVASYSDVYSKGEWDGGTFSLPIDTSQMRPSLMPYAVLWTVKGMQDIAPFFVINPSIHLAMRELHDYVNKNCSDWNSRELTFTPAQLIAGLYNGACAFNSEAVATDFTMTNALGSIRSYWIQYSAVWLLQSQVLNGIETDFSYTNSSVTLDVDRASKYQSFADSLASTLREQVRPLKMAMVKRGNAGGDGSASPLALRPGAMGVVSLSLSPVSKVGTMFNPLSWRSALLNGNMSLNSF